MKTSTQFQTPQTWARPVLRDVGAEWVKYINPPDGPNPCPEVPHSIVRIWTDDRDGQYIAKGREGGRQFVRDMLATWRRWPWATCYELANEPPCNSPRGSHAYFDREVYEDITHGRGTYGQTWATYRRGGRY